MLLQLSQFFSPLYSPLPCTPPPSSIPPSLSLCPWVIHISSLASPFPILFLTSPCLFCTYQVCFLLPVPFLFILPFSLPPDNTPCDLHFCDSVPVVVVCLVFGFQVQFLIVVSLLSFYCSYFFSIFKLFYCSVTVVCIFSPPLYPTPAKPTSLPCFHPPPWFCPCVLYSSS